MQVSLQYALTHFEDISCAVDRGEDIEIVRPGKVGIRLVPNLRPGQTAWRTPERPRAEIFGSLQGKMTMADDWDSPETERYIADLFEGSGATPRPEAGTRSE